MRNNNISWRTFLLIVVKWITFSFMNSLNPTNHLLLISSSKGIKMIYIWPVLYKYTIFSTFVNSWKSLFCIAIMTLWQKFEVPSFVFPITAAVDVMRIWNHKCFFKRIVVTLSNLTAGKMETINWLMDTWRLRPVHWFYQEIFSSKCWVNTFGKTAWDKWTIWSGPIIGMEDC